MFDQDMEKKKGLLSIGEAAKQGNISNRTLRYYEKLGLIDPDFVDTNGYRYYSSETVLKIPIIKYLKMMDFSLEEINIQLSDTNFCKMIESFDKMLVKSNKDMEEIYCRKEIIKDWKKLLEEACIVLSMKLRNINVRYFDKQTLIKYPIDFKMDYRASILDLEFANFVEKEDNKISGPVMFYFPSIKDRTKVEKNCGFVSAYYIQKALKHIKEEHKFIQEAGMYVTKYHVGAHEDLYLSYKELLDWEKSSDYEFVGPVIERFVTDYWSTKDRKKYVTELIAPVKLRGDE